MMPKRGAFEWPNGFGGRAFLTALLEATAPVLDLRRAGSFPFRSVRASMEPGCSAKHEVWPLPHRYGGETVDSTRERQKEERDVNIPEGLYAPPREVSIDQCVFYHRMDLPGVGAVGGEWDLRDDPDYLGGIDVDGARVLEIGPASGYVTSRLEDLGADVVSAELAPDVDWDVVPYAALDTRRIARERREGLERQRNAWWFTRKARGGKAKVWYGDTYQLPKALGAFDVSVMALVLLHTRDPARIIQRCAELTKRALVIVERRFPELGDAPVCRLVPRAFNDLWGTWWDFTPAFFTQYAEVLGFARTRVVDHVGRHAAPDGTISDMPLFTVVAHRE